MVVNTDIFKFWSLSQNKVKLFKIMSTQWEKYHMLKINNFSGKLPLRI